MGSSTNGMPEPLECPLDRRVVRRAVVAQLVTKQRRVRHHTLATRVLAVEGAQRIGGCSAVALFAQVRRVLADEPGDLVAVERPAVLVAHRVEQQTHAARGNAHRLVEAPQQRDDLGIDARLGHVEGLGADLPELPCATLLRSFVAKHRPGVVELGALAVGGQLVLERRANHARGALGPQRDRPAALVLEGVHLLGDDVGRLADTAGEDVSMLEERRVDGLVAVAREQVLRRALEVLPGTRGAGKHV